jgi:hypothetical protein
MLTNENPLEVALRAAAADPACRPDFYRLLMESKVFVIGKLANGEYGSRAFREREEIAIQPWEWADGKEMIPFFTSLEALERAITTPGSYLKLPARSLFEITKGAALVLNPTLDYGKEFLPHEVEALLSAGVTELPQQRVVTQETNVFLGQPQNYPTRMVESLTAFFKKRPQIKAAFLTLMHDPSHDERPCLVVGVQTDGDFEQLSREIGAVAVEPGPVGEPIDVYQVVSTDTGLSEYFLKNVKPFYKRPWRVWANLFE